ncbi:MAG: glycosyl hydrolase, partial [Planctomycetota bacterium]
PGEWTIIRFVCANTGEKLKVPSPNSNGLATDHFSHEATRVFIQHITNHLQQKIGELKSTALRQLYLPSYEVRGATWTPDFIKQFRKYCHYDMTPYLPALAGCVIENQDITSRFLFDYRKMLGDLLVDAYYRTASETANEAGLGIEAEAGGPGPPVHQVPVDALKALGSIDEMRGEFWPWREQRNQLWVVKETACAAHIYGRKRVHMEAFTGFRHWQDGPFDLKPSADRAFCEGMNHVVWHTSSHQPPEAGKPGWVYGAGSHLTPNLTWWSKAKPFIDYLSRCSFMLQQGLFVADVCYYYGDQGFNFVPAKHIDPSLGYGYDYDVINAEALLGRMSVKDGRFTLPDGMHYELLVLPDRKDMNLQVLHKIKELVEAGGTVIGPKPTQANGLTNYPTKDQQVKKLADTLWGNCDGKNVLEHRYGKGKIVWGQSLREILMSRSIGQDFHYSSDNNAADLDFIHRRTMDADIYFIRNRKNNREFVNAHFRVSARAPELWLPETGTILQQPVYEQTPEGVRVPLKLAPFGSLFVVFRKPVNLPHLVSVDPGINAATVTETEVRVIAFENGSYKMKTSSGRTIEFAIDQIPSAIQLTGPWDVYFGAGWGAPDSVKFADLKSWTEHEIPGIRNFSGTARYKKEFAIPPQWFGEDKKNYPPHVRRIYIDLGNLWSLGEVTLNGRPLGIVWKPPYRIEITKAAKAGQNKLEIEITNTWANRLVGDAHLPPDQRFGSPKDSLRRTNITHSGTPGKQWKDIPLRQSGLLGPVKLIQAVEKSISLTK